MRCFIYKSQNKQHLYLYIKNKGDYSTVPEALLKSLGKLELVLDLDLTPERRLAKEDPAKVITALNEKGYFIQLPPTEATAPTQLQ